MSRALTIEALFPEIANLHGDNANVTYLSQCRPDARVIRTALTDTPEFVTGDVDLVYLGPLTEEGQLKAIERLRPHRDRIEALIESGTTFLFTHNALEVLGSRIRNDDMKYDVQAVGLFELESTLRMFGRYNGKVVGLVDEAGPAHPVVGYKSQFSMVEVAEPIEGFPDGRARDRPQHHDGGRGRSPQELHRHLAAGPDPDRQPVVHARPVAAARSGLRARPRTRKVRSRLLRGASRRFPGRPSLAPLRASGRARGLEVAEARSRWPCGRWV